MAAPHRVRRRAALLVALALAVSTVVGTLLARAYWSESNAVHINPKEIESSTLIIGTHLIHLSALNDALYDIAQTSAEESGQADVFYKSELADNAWFNISAATTLVDITTGGLPVEDEVIEALFLTHHTKSDKITYDLRTGLPVNIFNIRDPYALETLEEMSPLKMHYDLTKESQGETSVTARIDQIWKTPIAPDPEVEATKKMAEYDKALADLQTYLDVLKANGGGAPEIGVVTSVMDAVDASRRYEVYLIAEKVLREYMEELGTKPPAPVASEEGTGDAAPEGTGEGTEAAAPEGAGDTASTEGETATVPDEAVPQSEVPAPEAPATDAPAPEAPATDAPAPEAPATDAPASDAPAGGGGSTSEPPDPELLSAVTESLSNVQNALITYSGKMLDEGTTTISKAQFQFSTDLISHAGAADHAACDQDVRNLLALQNILNNVISDLKLETSLLDGLLLSQATSTYTGVLWQGENAAYRTAVAKSSAQVLLNRIADDAAGDANSKRNELEFLIEAKCLRSATQAALEFIDQRLALTTGSFAASVPSDAFSDGSKASVDAHIVFLTTKRRALELALGGNDMDKLAAEKEDLQNQRLAALDNNDLATAKALEGQIADKEGQLRSMEQESAAQLSQLGQDINDLNRQLEDAKNSGDDAKAAGLESKLSQAKADRDNLQNSLSDGSMGAMVSQLKKDGLDGIANGNSSQTTNAVDGLSGLLGADPSLVLPAMQEMHDAIATQQALGGGDASMFADSLAAIEQAILDNPDAYGASMRTDHNANDLQSLFDAYAADNAMDPYGDLTLLIALQLYYDETGSGAALQLIQTTARRMRNLGSPLIFDRINDGTGEYLPLTAIESLTQRRYIWNQNLSMGILARGGDYYGFTLYSNRVQRDKEGIKTESMARAAKQLKGLHIPDDYTYDTFGTQAVYLSNTTLGCICNDEVMTHAQAILALFLA